MNRLYTIMLGMVIFALTGTEQTITFTVGPGEGDHVDVIFNKDISYEIQGLAQGEYTVNRDGSGLFKCGEVE